jgi:hypothetical protein
MRWYPGERLDNLDVRQGSINSTVDYLLTPDGISDARYPDNSDMALILQLQAAMLVNKCLLRTEVVSVTPEFDNDNEARKRIDLRYTQPDGTTIDRYVYADRLVVSSGLGQPSYGFDINKSKAGRVLEASASWDGFPKLSDTLVAFKALGSKESDRPEPGETIVIYGNGNSADTLIEYMGGLFQGGNKGVRNIKKIYVVTTGELSQRPRYAAISDLRGRNGRENLVELVNARVGDIDFDTDGRNIDASTKLQIFDSDGNRIKNAAGAAISADNVIAATGFKSGLDAVLNPVTGKSLKDPDTLEKVVLPTNKNVSVADRLKKDRNILLVGTGSRPGFEIIDKLTQLPNTAREALLRNGAENAVAIGFRAPDTQAAVRLFTDQMPPKPVNASIKKAPVTTLKLHDDIQAGETLTFPRDNTNPTPQAIRKDIVADSSILTPLLVQSLSDIRVDKVEQMVSEYDVRFINGSIAITSLGTSSSNLVDAIAQACANPYFYGYAQQALSRRRDGGSIEVKLHLKNGKISPRLSFAQPA